MDTVARLVAFRNYTGLSNSQFADRAGIPRPTLSQFLNGRNKRISDDFTAKLHQAYPNLNVLWLLFGEGDMLMNPNIQFSEGKNDLFEAENEDQSTDTESNKYQQQGENRVKSESPICAKEVAQSPNTTNFGHTDSQTAFNEHATGITSIERGHNGPVVPADPAKRIQSIMVFYSDNSYEIFTPSN